MEENRIEKARTGGLLEKYVTPWIFAIVFLALLILECRNLIFLLQEPKVPLAATIGLGLAVPLTFYVAFKQISAVLDLFG